MSLVNRPDRSTNQPSTELRRLRMTSSDVVETLVNVTPSSASQDYTHLNDPNLPTYFKIDSNFG